MEIPTPPHRRRSNARSDYPDFPRPRHRSPSSDHERDRKRLRNDQFSTDARLHNPDRSQDHDRRRDRDYNRDRDPYAHDSRRGYQSYPPKRPAVHGPYSNGGGSNGDAAFGRRRPGLVSRPYDAMHEGSDAVAADGLNPHSNGPHVPVSISPHGGTGTHSGLSGPQGMGAYGSRAGGLHSSAPTGSYPPAHAKSRRLYIGNVPFQAGLTDYALVQFFSALYVAGFRPNLPGEPLPVVSFWLHGDGKFGFMELRGEQETVNMMQFNQVMLHGRLLKVNRPSDYRPEIHNPNGGNIQPEEVNAEAVLLLCEKLDGLAAPPPLLISRAQAIRAARENDQYENGVDADATNTSDISLAPRPDLAPDVGNPSGVVQNEYSQATTNQVESVALKGEEGLNRDAGLAPEGIPPPNSDNMEPEQSKSTSNDIKPEHIAVISLQNLVTDEDLDGDDEEYNEIVEDVEGECGTYGEVVSVNIPRTGHWKKTAFVQFADEAGAKRAIEALAKRVFDGRKIVAIGLEGVSTAEEAANRSG